jgi:hypothetical protein
MAVWMGDDNSFPTFHDKVQLSKHEEPSITSQMNRHLQNVLPSKLISLTVPSLEKENCYKLPVLGSDKHQMFSLYVGWLQEECPFVFSLSPLQTDVTCITQKCVKPNNKLCCWGFSVYQDVMLDHSHLHLICFQFWQWSKTEYFCCWVACYVSDGSIAVQWPVTLPTLRYLVQWWGGALCIISLSYSIVNP